MNDETLGHLWDAIYKLAEFTQAMPIKDKLWVEHAKEWTVVVNGHSDEREHQSFKIGPYNAVLWYNDLPAAYFSPFEGTVAAGSVVNADAFIKAVDEVTT